MRKTGVTETDAAGGVAPYRDDPHADVDDGKGLLLPWYWDALYVQQWGGLFTYDVFSHLWGGSSGTSSGWWERSRWSRGSPDGWASACPGCRSG